MGPRCFGLWRFRDRLRDREGKKTPKPAHGIEFPGIFPPSIRLLRIPALECHMSTSSYARRKAHRALGREFKAGKLDEAAAAAYKAVEDKRLAKLKAKTEKK